MDFEKRLSLMMHERNYSYEELSNKLEISKSQISRWLKGEAKPRSGTVREMAEIFDVPYPWMEEDKGYPVFEGNELVIVDEDEINEKDSLTSKEIESVKEKLVMLERDLYNWKEDEKQRHKEVMATFKAFESYINSLREKIGGPSLLDLLPEDE